MLNRIEALSAAMKAKKSVKLFVPLLLLATALQAQEEGKTREAGKALFEDRIPSSRIAEWRRHIHQNPELSFEAVNTSQYVEDLLKSFGNIQVFRPRSTSVRGILKGSKPGKTVAFRADMDAFLHSASALQTTILNSMWTTKRYRTVQKHKYRSYSTISIASKFTDEKLQS